MNTIIFPLKPQMQGPEVADLQDALLLFLDRSLLLANDEGARQELSAALKPERLGQTCGEATKKLVSLFQKEKGESTESTTQKVQEAETLLRAAYAESAACLSK